MMKLKIVYTFLTFTLLYLTTIAQVPFDKVYGNKGTYFIEVPKRYFPMSAVGANVDIKYSNDEGASIITVVKNLPSNVRESDINHMNDVSNYEFIEQMESMGMQNISVIKRGFIYINGVKSHYAYYRDDLLYYHSITQFKKRKILNLLYTCEYHKKDLYMSYIFRVMNSIHWY